MTIYKLYVYDTAKEAYFTKKPTKKEIKKYLISQEMEEDTTYFVFPIKVIENRKRLDV